GLSENGYVEGRTATVQYCDPLAHQLGRQCWQPSWCASGSQYWWRPAANRQPSPPRLRPRPFQSSSPSAATRCGLGSRRATIGPVRTPPESAYLALNLEPSGSPC